MTYRIVDRNTGFIARDGFRSISAAKAFAERAYPGGQYQVVKKSDEAKQYSLREHKLNRDGYDSRGQYFGTGETLWDVVCREDGQVVHQFRAAYKGAAQRILEQKLAKGQIR